MRKLMNFVRLLGFVVAVAALLVVQSQATATQSRRATLFEASAYDQVGSPDQSIESDLVDELFGQGF